MKVKDLIEQLQGCREDAEVELHLLHESFTQKLDIIFDAREVEEVSTRTVRIEGYL